MKPILLELGSFKLYSYPLIMGMAWGLAYQWCRFRIAEKRLPKQGFELLFWGNFLLAWVGAKLFYILFSGTFDMSYNLNFWFGGGFVFIGGLFLAALYTLLY